MSNTYPGRALRLAAVAVALASCLTASDASAQSTNQADRVEEDWVLTVDENVSADGPQVNTVMAASADPSLPVVVLDINYRHDPTFVAGGMQALVYDQSGQVSSATLISTPLIFPNEIVRWTQRLTLTDGTVQYSLPAVNSASWGNFATAGPAATLTTSLRTLKDYDPDLSVANSGPAWKTTGLKSLSLVEVRYFQGETLLSTDTATRAVNTARPFTRP